MYIRDQRVALEREEYEREMADILLDEYFLRGGIKIMHREIIDLNETELMFKDLFFLNDYVWKGNLLIPIELLEEY